MEYETAMAAALRKAGGPLPILAEFEAQLVRMIERAQQRGASLEDLAAVLERAAQKLRGEGQLLVAVKGQPNPANPAQTERDGKANVVVPDVGQVPPADPSQPIASGEGQCLDADKAKLYMPPTREPLTVSEAGRILRSVQQPGAGSLQRHAYEVRAALRGESWLLTYCVPGGPQLLELTWDDADGMERRMFREGGERLHAAVVIRALRKEAESLGKVSGHQKIGGTLTPAIIAKVSEEYEFASLCTKARNYLRRFQSENAMIEGVE